MVAQEQRGLASKAGVCAVSFPAMLSRLPCQNTGGNTCYLDLHTAQHGIAGKRISPIFVHQRVQVCPGICGSHTELCAGLIVSPSMRQAHNARHHVVCNLYFCLNSAAIMLDLRSSAILKSKPRSVAGVD